MSSVMVLVDMYEEFESSVLVNPKWMTTKTCSYMAQHFLHRDDWNYDYGYITHPGNSSTGFGFQGFVDRGSLGGVDHRTCGYPTNQNNYCIPICELGAADGTSSTTVTCSSYACAQYCDAGG